VAKLIGRDRLVAEDRQEDLFCSSCSEGVGHDLNQARQSRTVAGTHSIRNKWLTAEGLANHATSFVVNQTTHNRYMCALLRASGVSWAESGQGGGEDAWRNKQAHHGELLCRKGIYKCRLEGASPAVHGLFEARHHSTGRMQGKISTQLLGASANAGGLQEQRAMPGTCGYHHTACVDGETSRASPSATTEQSATHAHRSAAPNKYSLGETVGDNTGTGGCGARKI